MEVNSVRIMQTPVHTCGSYIIAILILKTGKDCVIRTFFSSLSIVAALRNRDATCNIAVLGNRNRSVH